MAWARLDDHFHGNPKVLATPLAALGLYALGLSYCADQLTDGFIPKSVVLGWSKSAAAARLLVQHKLWEVTRDGYRVHDYLEWNRSRGQVLADREAARKRKDRERHAAAQPELNGMRPAGVTP